LNSRSELLAGFVCAILSLAASPVHAFTLGELNGVALIGRSLDVTVPVQSGPGEEASASCFTAELFHADTRQAAPNLSVTATSSGAAVVRIQANTLVDEPIVSVELRARCGSTSTRRYTLLADIAPIETLAPSASAAPRLPQVARSVTLPATVDRAAVATNGPTSRAGTTDKPTRAVPKPRLRPVLAAAKPAGVAHAPGSELVLQQPGQALGRSGKAVLKLDPLDVFSDRIAALDSPMLFEPAADALLQAQQISTLEADLKTLRTRLARSDAELLELKTLLQQSQTEQVSAWWVYLLGGLVLLCLAALAWLLVLQRKARLAPEPKWHDSQQQDSKYDLSEEMGSANDPPPIVPPRQEPALAATRPAPVLADPAVDTPRSPDTVPAALDGVQSFSVEPILDIRQQAEFFVSLGQTDRALHILKKQIDGASQPNPLIFLDLLSLQHSLGLKPDFRDSRNAFNRHFTGAVPEFAAFNTEGKDLLEYPEVLDRLVLDWPGPKSLSLLNGWIVRTHKGAGHTSFDLAAFRDLLLLHAVAEEIAEEAPADAPEPPTEVSVSAVPDIFKTPDSSTSVGAFDASMGLELMPKFDAKKIIRSSLPEELRVQSLDMDLSAFEGPVAATIARPAEVPPPRVPDIFLSDDIAQAHLPPVDKT
jgi:pilus assembly protein FimV